MFRLHNKKHERRKSLDDIEKLFSSNAEHPSAATPMPSPVFSEEPSPVSKLNKHVFFSDEPMTLRRYKDIGSKGRIAWNKDKMEAAQEKCLAEKMLVLELKQMTRGMGYGN